MMDFRTGCTSFLKCMQNLHANHMQIEQTIKTDNSAISTSFSIQTFCILSYQLEHYPGDTDQVSIRWLLHSVTALVNTGVVNRTATARVVRNILSNLAVSTNPPVSTDGESISAWRDSFVAAFRTELVEDSLSRKGGSTSMTGNFLRCDCDFFLVFTTYKSPCFLCLPTVHHASVRHPFEGTGAVMRHQPTNRTGIKPSCLDMNILSLSASHPRIISYFKRKLIPRVKHMIAFPPCTQQNWHRHVRG